jgi:hypothetical protein
MPLRLSSGMIQQSSSHFAIFALIIGVGIFGVSYRRIDSGCSLICDSHFLIIYKGIYILCTAWDKTIHSIRRCQSLDISEGNNEGLPVFFLFNGHHWGNPILRLVGSHSFEQANLLVFDGCSYKWQNLPLLDLVRRALLDCHIHLSNNREFLPLLGAAADCCHSGVHRPHAN